MAKLVVKQSAKAHGPLVYIPSTINFPIVPPTVTTSSSTVTRSVGDTVEFRCDVRGSPPPRIQWVKDGGHATSRSAHRAGQLSCVCNTIARDYSLNEVVGTLFECFSWIIQL